MDRCWICDSLPTVCQRFVNGLEINFKTNNIYYKLYKFVEYYCSGILGFRSILRGDSTVREYPLNHILAPRRLSEGRGFSKDNFFCWTSLSVASGKNLRMSQNPSPKTKKDGGVAIIARRTITITARTGTSGTATATGTIPIMYGCLIPLGLSNWKPPRTEP